MTRIYRIHTLAMLMAMSLGLLSVHAENDAPVKDGLRAHNLFQDNMVVQRNKAVDVWGWSKPGDTVTVTFAGKSADGTAGKDGKWKVSLPELEASSKPATMTIASKEGEITLKNILVGDVWVLGGQSNMQWGIGATENGNLEVASANFPEIRMLTVPKIYGPEMKENFPRAKAFSKITGTENETRGDWQICSPDTVGGMSAIGYVMGRRVHMATQVPIALINTSRGGSTVEAWTPLESMRKLESEDAKHMLAAADERIAAYDDKADLEKQIRKYDAQVAKYKDAGKDVPADLKRPTTPSGGPLKTHKIPGNCYSSIISPISGFAVKGVLWHQGYNNCFQGVRGAQMYRAVFPVMIKGWRTAFNDEALPFCILSQCTAGKMQSPDDFLPKITDIGARIREAQYLTYLDLLDAGDKNIGFVSTYDLRHSNFHPRVKVPAGERAAVWALVTQYGMEGKMISTPPRLKEKKTVDGALHLTFDMPVSGCDDGRPMEGFCISGEDKKFHMASVVHLRTGGTSRKPTYDKATIVLSSPLVEEPVHFRYAWARNPMGNVRRGIRFSNEVMLPTQRSDNWTNNDLLNALTGKDAEDPLQIGKSGGNQLRSALAKEDERRKIAEAKALLLATEGDASASTK